MYELLQNAEDQKSEFVLIELDTKELGYFSYFLVYETRFKHRYHKIKFSNLVLKQER